MSRTLRWAAGLLATGTLAVLGLASPAQAATVSQPLRTMIANLPVATEIRTGYNRDLFPHWVDADGDGCNSRYEVLIAEAVTRPTVGSRGSVSRTPIGARMETREVRPLDERREPGKACWPTSPART
ncbi:hypothetical protein [Plantactinospora sonchi]|uniref:Uncharacterized protein n=1 Tax=Plantactinospora sonchi TaxID=1544735 RepID=A0ABU7S2Z7_9ACTN